MTGSDVPSLSGIYLKKSQTTFCWDRPSRNRKDVGEAAFLAPKDSFGESHRFFSAERSEKRRASSTSTTKQLRISTSLNHEEEDHV
jgi:hypothetical protein